MYRSAQSHCGHEEINELEDRDACDMGGLTDNNMLEELQQDAFQYFIHETNPSNGLVADKTRQGWPASIAATGLALTVYPVAVERGFMARDDAILRILMTLRFFWNSTQGPEPSASGYKGFYYHFLDFKTGRRAGNCELATVDSAMLFAGALAAAQYFDRDSEEEQVIRDLADQLYSRADWQWALGQGRKGTVTHGWKPESGFLKYRWEGYDEALILYVLGLGSPTHPLPEECYDAWAATYEWKKIYGYEYLYAGPLFIHQYSHIWIDFRGIKDRFMRARGIDYFENSRRATHIQQEYAIRNPHDFHGYGEYCWGITASDGPGPTTLKINGVERRFYDYLARGAPSGPDDGTIAPWSVVASLPFAPAIVMPTMHHFHQLGLHQASPYGFKATFNATYPVELLSAYGWVSPYHYGINEGPIVLMIDNYRSGLVWRLMQKCPYIVNGLRRAAFRGGWL